MIQLVKTPTANVFYNLVENSNKEMILCAPFIKNDTVKKILSKKNLNAKLTVITEANISNFIQNSSDLSAIRELLENNASVLNYQHLHAKIYLFDMKKALITSANLTSNGMYHNYEYGVMIDNDTASINNIETDLIEMIEDKDAGSYTLKNIAEIEKKLKSIEKLKYKIKEIEGDNILVLDNVDDVASILRGWKKEIFLIISSFKVLNFTSHELYKYAPILRKKYPSNNHIEDKIRQILQYLRDMGLVKFVKPGEYKKLFK